MVVGDASRWGVAEGADARGRRVVATDRIRAGEVVLTDTPFAFVRTDAHLCDCCLERSSPSTLLRCSACKQAAYLNREHQARAWKAGHREECAALRAVAPHVPPPTALLALRIVQRNLNEEQQQQQQQQTAPQHAQQGQRQPGRYGEVLGLQSHWEDMPDGAKLRCAHLAAVAARLLASSTARRLGGSVSSSMGRPGPQGAEAAAGSAARTDADGPSEGGADVALPAGASTRDLALLIARLACNAHTLADGELAPIGVGIYPLGSMVNHSCRPNAAQSFRGPTIVFRALRDIAPGEEVVIAYVELAATRWERRAALLRQYYFDIDAPGMRDDGDAAAAAAAADGPDVATGVGSAASGAAAEERHRQRPPPPQQQQQGPGQQHEPRPDSTQPLPGGGRLCLHDGSTGGPPWPADPRDADLTAMVAIATFGAATSSSTSRSSSSQQGQPQDKAAAAAAGEVVGGMWGELPERGGDVAAEESFELAAEEGQSRQRGSNVGGCSSSRPAGQPPPEATIHCWGRSAQQQQQQQQEQQQEQHDKELQRAAAAGLAERYAAALHLLAEVDGLLAGAKPEAAAALAGQLEQAISSLSVPITASIGSSVASGSSSSSAGVDRATSAQALALGPRHIMRLRLLAAHLRAAIAAGAWAAALASARALLPLYQATYPPAWPSLALHLASLAKLEHLQGEGRPGAALAAAEAALRMLSMTHGKGGPVVAEVERVRLEAAAEVAHLGGGGGSPYGCP